MKAILISNSSWKLEKFMLTEKDYHLKQTGTFNNTFIDNKYVMIYFY